ncbi:RNA polymerase I-specific transcription initiation factor RRN7 [Candida viswanathii]|uniref:RNA polymerase I-specific transcription initiation factor RRN7 n=1 Tax=Candida viswanathii TaxID=5486 RepID=A0A367YPW7_9ASCO|nr:RNA polymerase I-specific transcription initiation factor RRN7 [Candida viswanathii]
MSRQLWFRGPVCGTDNCRSRLFRSQDGLTICQFGHVLEGAVEINDDPDGPGMVQTRRINTIAVDERGHMSSVARSTSQAAKKTQERLYGEDATSMYHRCLQILLKHELNKFIELFFSDGIKLDLTLIVKRNWVRLLSSEEKQMIDTLDLICLIYISALELQAYPIYVSDLIENIKSNNVPYIRTLHLIPKDMLDQLPTLYHNRLQPVSLPDNGHIFKRLQSTGTRVMKSTLSVQLSFYFPFLFRVLSEYFLLPNAMDMFMICFNILKSKPCFEIDFQKRFNPFVQNFPEVYVSSVVMAVVKENFRKVNKNQLAEWLQQLSEYDLNNEYSSKDTRLLDWSDEKVDKYCDWIYDHIIPKKSKLDEDNNSESLTTMEKRLFQIFCLDNDTRTTESPPSGETPMYQALKNIMDSERGNANEATLQELDAKLDSKFVDLLGL